MTVEEFIAAEAAKPFVWGESDCAMTASRWVEAVTGINPIVAHGRLYGCKRQALEWMAEPGGLAAAMTMVMDRAGFAACLDPRPGDVGLIRHDERICVAILAGTTWVSRDETGMIGEPAGSHLGAWRIG